MIAGVVCLTASGCGSGHRAATQGPAGSRRPVAGPVAATSVPGVATALAPAPAPQALVTDERQNALLVVALPSGRVVRRVTMPSDPEDIAVTAGAGGIVTVVSSGAGRVSVLHRATLRPIRILGGFTAPHIVTVSPNRRYAYVTDDARGTVTVIRLSDATITAVAAVGAGAHHLTFSPDGHRAWVTLGESADRISVLDTRDLAHPRLIAHFSPGFPAHDLSFSPDGRRIWVTSATGTAVGVFSARSGRLLFRVPVGPPPQHVAFAGSTAYLTSGYGGMIERVKPATGRVVGRARDPYGSFELAAADGYVVTSSLLRGTLTVYTPQLRLLRVVRLASATREVAIAAP